MSRDRTEKRGLQARTRVRLATSVACGALLAGAAGYGSVLNATAAVLPLVASAAAAKAAGDASATSRLLGQAAVQQRDHPTYHGGAWHALGTALLTSGTLGTCSPGEAVAG